MSRTTSRLVGLAALCALECWLAPASAASADDWGKQLGEYQRVHGDRPIAAVRLEGLHRTRPGVVQQWLRCGVGCRLSSCDLPRIHEELYRLAIFSSIELSLNDRPEGVELVLTFAEKWTLYPVPVLWYSPGTTLIGAVLVEANLFGYNKGLAFGGAWSNRGWYTLLGYNDPNIAYTHLWGSAHAFLGSGIVENDARDGAVQQTYDMSRFDFEYALGWTLWDRLSPTYNGALRLAHVEAVHVPGDAPPIDAEAVVQALQLIYSDRRYRDFYDEGSRLSAEVQHAFPLDRSSSAYDDVILDAKWAEHAPLAGVVAVHGRAFLGSLPVVFEERLGGLDGSRTLPGGGLVAADRYASLSFAYEVPLITLDPGSLIGVGFAELGRYSRNAERAVDYGGPGLGFRFYLKHIAIPAVGVDAGYEVGSRQVRFSVAVGYRPVR